MREIQDILEAYESVGNSGPAATLATIVKTTGATYRGPGARMLLIEGGHHAGLLCGGVIDKELHERARAVHTAGRARTYSLAESSHPQAEKEQNPERAGRIEVLLEPLTGDADDPAVALLARISSSRKKLIVATVFRADGIDGVSPGDRLVVDSTGTLTEALADSALSKAVEKHAREVLSKSQGGCFDYSLGEGAEVFIESLCPPLALAIFGGGLDSCPIVKLSTEVGWPCSIIDPNPAYANKGRFYLASEVYVARPEEILDRVPLDEFTVAIVITHDYEQDLALIERLLPSPVAYIGVVGPASRAEDLCRDLESRSLEITAAQRARLFAPAGIEIGAETPQETALAVLAQIRAQVGNRP